MPRPHAPSQPPRSGPSGCGALQRLLFHGPDSLQQLNGVVAGQGIAGTTARELPGKDGRVVWKVYRDETDELGMRHVFYRQHLMPAGALAEALGEPLASDGIPVLGGEVGVHTLADGTPRAVFGRQYLEVGVPAFPAVLRAAHAVAVAEDVLQRRGGFASPARFTAEHRQAVLQGSRLVLEKLQDRPLALIWHVPAWDDGEQAHLVRLDAASGGILEVVSTIPAATCVPASTAPQQSAWAMPQNYPAVWLRDLWAVDVPDRLPTYTHEAYKKPVSGWYPGIEIYFQTDMSSPYKCSQQEPWYGVLPVGSSGGSASYNFVPGAVSGPSAGDALWHTHVTMSTLREVFGRCGYTGSCDDPVKVYLKQGGSGVAKYAHGPNKPCRHKTNTVCFYPSCPPPTCCEVLDEIPGRRGCVEVEAAGSYPRQASASLDVIGHEWGHGVVFNVGIDYDVQVRQQLHEGFANVLGHAVEWLNQPAGNGFEKADWCFGEDHNTDYWPWWGGDCPSSWSRADWFVPVVNHASGTSYWSYHREHNLGDPEDPHVKGHMLAVVHYLLSQGGTNPVCGSYPGLAGCTTSVTAQGVTKASKILMRVITGFATPNMQWSDLADLGKLAAWDLYARCYHWKYDAIPEQQSVEQAFAAIGYPSPGGYYTCW